MFTLATHSHPARRRFPWYAHVLAWPLRRFAVLVAIIAIAQRTVWRRVRSPGWHLEGACKSCGRCCENLLLEVGDDPRAVSVWRNFWHECVYDFYQKGNTLEHGTQRFAAYGCHNFTADRRCSRYALRPFVCRAYPALALSDRPTVREHCGLRVIDD